MDEDDHRLTVVDLFCGAGGISEGFRQNGFEIELGLDYWEPAIKTHELNHPDSDHVLMDINELETPEDIDRVIPDADIIVGGPPCVSFSNSNKSGNGDKSEGLKLIKQMLKIIAWKKKKGSLKYWVMENVPRSDKHIKERYTWDELGLPGSGPTIEVKRPEEPYNTADYGVPQCRKRIIYGDYPSPKKTNKDDWITVRDVFENLGNPLNEDENPDMIKDPCYPSITLEKKDLTDHFYDSRVEKYRWKKAKRLKQDHGYMGEMSFPEDIDRPARTVMATRAVMAREAMLFRVDIDDDGEYDYYRLPTVREIASFMSFPITYQFPVARESQKFRLIGNAVPCRLASAIAKAIAEEEDMDSPQKYKERESHPILEDDLDLTGKEWEKKDPPKRRDNSRFKRHIEQMKEHAFRVEISNENSDFDEDEVLWETMLHKGQGAGSAKMTIPTKSGIEELKENEISAPVDNPSPSLDWNEFEKEVKERYDDRVPNPQRFQEVYVNRGEGKELGPEEFIEDVRDLIDEHFPKNSYENVYLINDDALDIDVDKIPVRMVAGLIACKYITDKVTEKA